MTETQRRIKELKRSLPNMKEKVVAVAVLLALSLTMMASVSYAWYTMSFAPELSGVNTTVSANGNLEVALSGSDGREPGTSLVGDSFAAQNQTTHNANTTWGNLINLSGNYGIEELVLRPATFKPDSTAYLSSMKYGEDGRVEGTTADFAFTTWSLIDEGTGKHAFTVSTEDAFGVRAISSVKFDDTLGKAVILLKMDQAREVLKNATDKYLEVYNGEFESGRTYADVLCDLMNVYLDCIAAEAVERFPAAGLIVGGYIDGDPDITAYVEELYTIYETFYNAIVLYEDALDFLTNVQIEMGIAENKVNLGSAKAKYNTLKGKVEKDLGILEGYLDDETVNINDPAIETVINDLVNIDEAYINGGGIDNKQVKSLKGMEEAIKVFTNLSSNSTISVLVTQGYMKEFEDLHGVKGNMTLYPLKVVKATNVTGKMSTNSTGSLFEEAISKTLSLDTSYLSTMTADDTYGMVIDLWFRSNSPSGTLLALDGMVKTVTRYEDTKTILTGESKSRTVYSYQIIGSGTSDPDEILLFRGEADDNGKFEEGAYYDITTYARAYQLEPKEVQKTDEDGNLVYDENGEPVMITVFVEKPDSPITDDDVTVKRKAYVDIVGFESSNRYDGDLAIPENGEISATQGTGSCFVFYADSPEDAEASFKMLGQLKLAFMDANRTLLAQAKFDVERYYAETGRYTVPITITETDAVVTSEVDGSTIYGITALQQNVATRISVVLYLEGEGLENKMAFSNGSITGSLNFQFCTSADLDALKNTDLADKVFSISASMEGAPLDPYTGAVQKRMLTAIIDGIDAQTVEATFVRKINASQGTRTETVSLTRQGKTNTWLGECGFLLPGTYELSSLWVDGMEYKLPEKITLTMAGFALQSVHFCDTEDAPPMAMTAESYVTRPVTITFSSEKQPDKVEARFRSEDGAFVSAVLTKNQDGSWSGTAAFTESGVYSLRWIVASIAKPGTNPVEYETAYYELEGEYKTFTAYLGLRAQVRLNNSNSNIRFEFTGRRTYPVSIKITTNTGDELRALDNVDLYYGVRGSNVEANGLSAKGMTWDGSTYNGEFVVDKPGAFSFAKVRVGDQIITVATAAPTITAISLTPPEYVHSNATPGAIILGGDSNEKAYYVAKIDEFYSGGVSAVFVYKYGNETKTVVVPEDSGYRADKEPGYYYFPIPNSADGTRNGNWVVTELRFTDVYDAAGNFYGEGSEDFQPYAAFYRQEVNYAFTVLDTVEVTFDSLVLNNKAEFMDPQKLIDKDGNYFGLTITAPGVNIPEGIDISNVQLTLNHNIANMKEYGGYEYSNSNDSATNSLAKPKADMVYSSENEKWYVTDSAAVQLAGTYSASVSFHVGGTVNGQTIYGATFNEGDDVVRVKVYSTSPKLTVVSAKTNTWDIGTEFNAHTGSESTQSAITSVSNSYDAATNSLTVYIAATYWEGMEGRGTGIYYNYKEQNGYPGSDEEGDRNKTCPQVVLKLSNAGSSFDTASFALAGDNDLSISYTFNRGSETTGTFTSSSLMIGWVADTRGYDIPCVGTIGARFSTRKVFGSGKQISKISMTCSGVTYVVDLDTSLTINNPK